MKNTEKNKGTWGEQLVANFFDSNYSKIFSFPNPKTKNNAQITDVLIWLNRTVLLIEVKTRDDGRTTTSIEGWAKSRIEEGVEQLINGYNRIKLGELINLSNSFYHTELVHEGISRVIGLIVLVHDEDCIIYPSTYVNDIYKKEIPIHVILWNDLQQMVQEIDTVSDFEYYLNDRFDYLEYFEVPLNKELNALGIYKKNINKFPHAAHDFINGNCWNDYRTSMAKEIQLRDEDNKHSVWIDKIENVFTQNRKLFDEIPLGLYFAWELGTLHSRVRAKIGKKLDTVQEWFESDKSSRQFSCQNCATGNWLVFYFSKSDQKAQAKELERLVRFKIIQLKHVKAFQFGVYGFGFLVSKIYPTQLLGLGNAIVVSSNAIGGFTEDELEQAHKLWGQEEVLKIEEFPSEKK